MSSKKVPASMTAEPMFVLFADISKWSINDASGQKAQIMALCQAAKEVFSASKLTLQWQAGTGDGFAVAFPPGTSSLLAIQTACSLFEKIHKQGEFEIRLSLTQGSVVFYENPLTRANDVVGPAVIRAKRLLDGSPSGSLLIGEDVANDVQDLDASWKKRLVEHGAVTDKHDRVHRAHRYVPDSETKSNINFTTTVTTTAPPITVELMTIARRLREQFGLTLQNQAIQDIEKAYTASLPAVGGLILFWLDAACKGLQPDMVIVIPKRGEKATQKVWVQSLTPLPTEIQSVIKPVATTRELAWITDQTNLPKVWLRSQIPPMTDQPGLSLSIGGSDFRNSKALEWAFTHQVDFRNESLTLREVYERGLLRLHEDLFGLVAATIVMLTSDDCIVVAQRGNLTWAKERYSISCEEGWDPNEESNPYKTVLRCLQEEWNLDALHGVEVGPEHVRLVAIGREWGHYWNTVLVYVVDLPCSSDVVIENWVSFPKDAGEAAGIGVIPIRNWEQRKLLLELFATEEIRKGKFTDAKWAGVVGDGKLHETTGAARVLFALAHHFGVEESAADIEKMLKAQQSKTTAGK